MPPEKPVPIGDVIRARHKAEIALWPVLTPVKDGIRAQLGIIAKTLPVVDAGDASLAERLALGRARQALQVREAERAEIERPIAAYNQELITRANEVGVYLATRERDIVELYELQREGVLTAAEANVLPEGFKLWQESRLLLTVPGLREAVQASRDVGSGEHEEQPENAEAQLWNRRLNAVGMLVNPFATRDEILEVLDPVGTQKGNTLEAADELIGVVVSLRIADDRRELTREGNPKEFEINEKVKALTEKFNGDDVWINRYVDARLSSARQQHKSEQLMGL